MELYSRVRVLLLTDVIFFLLFAVLLAWRERQFKFLGLACALIVSVLSVYGTSTVVRSAAAPGTERLLLVRNALVPQLFRGERRIPTGRGDSTYEFNGRFGALAVRTGQLWLFHVVDDKSPDPVPYWGGKTYRPLFTSFIPRAIYPDKTEERVGSEFGRRYGFLSQDDLHISINLPWLPSCWPILAVGG